MIKYIRNVALLIAILFQLICQKDTSPIHDADTPEWLKNYIEEIQNNSNYFGAKIYRYEWKDNFIYHIMIPISSCAYCEVYKQSGTKFEFKDDSTFQDFLNNRRNGIIIWEWENNN